MSKGFHYHRWNSPETQAVVIRDGFHDVSHHAFCTQLKITRAWAALLSWRDPIFWALLLGSQANVRQNPFWVVGIDVDKLPALWRFQHQRRKSFDPASPGEGDLSIKFRLDVGVIQIVGELFDVQIQSRRQID